MPTKNFKQTISKLIDQKLNDQIYQKSENEDQYLNLIYEIINVLPKIKIEVDTTKTYYENFEQLYIPQKNYYHETLRIANTKPEAVKGLHICKFCKCDEFYIWSAQTRSGDEGTTNYKQCKGCGKRGREN